MDRVTPVAVDGTAVVKECAGVISHLNSALNARSAVRKDVHSEMEVAGQDQLFPAVARLGRIGVQGTTVRGVAVVGARQ